MEYKRLTKEEVEKLEPGDRVNMGNGRIVIIEKISTEVSKHLRYNKDTKNFEAYEEVFIYCTDNENQFRWDPSVLLGGTIETLDDNVLKCAYCGAIRPPSDFIDGTIIFQSRKQTASGYKRFVDRKTNKYCFDKSCHGHDQMAHEG